MKGPYRQFRQSVRAMLGLFLVFVMLPGCSTRVIPPAQPQQPVTVHLMDHGRHASLILPAPETGWVRYAHGEWRWYAKHETGFWRAVSALFLPTDAAIARGWLESVPGRGEYSPAIPEGFETIHSFSVEKHQVTALRSRLESHFEAPEKTYFQARYNLHFVPYPQAYSVLSNSNQVMAQWLRELGAEVESAGLLSDWRLQARDGPSP
ncbi:MAG: DUF2459 domain-containing protein [Oleiphilaceae bacterium]|nr:DUF2459 domain-containing protein [Oleiphilaceae bacterium]